MSCDGGHLGFPIGIKNRNLVKDIPMIIHLQFGFSQFISFREEDLWNFSQSEHIIGPGSHVEYPTGTKNRNFVEDHLRNIPAKFGSNWPSGFGEEAWNVKSLQTTDDRCQVMAIVHLDLWSRWTNKVIYFNLKLKTTNCTKFQVHIEDYKINTYIYTYNKTQISVHWCRYLKSRSDLRVFSNRRPFQILRSMADLLVRAYFSDINGCQFENLKKDIDLKYRCMWHRIWTWIWGLDIALSLTYIIHVY